MKNLILMLLLFAIPATGFSQGNKSVRKFYRQFKKGKETKNFIVPGFLIRLGTGLARDIVKTDEEYEMLKMARKIRQARILFSEEYNPVRKADFSDFVKNVRNDSFDDLISVRSEGEDVSVMIKEDGEKIKGLLVVISGEDSFMMLHLKTKLKYKDINKLMELFKDEIPIKQKEKEPEERVPVA